MKSKTLKNKAMVPVAVLSLLLTQAALAEGGGASGVGGGGKAVVCFNNKSIVKKLKEECLESLKVDPEGKDCNVISQSMLGNITSIETFDLYEAKLKRLGEPQDLTIVPFTGKDYFDYTLKLAEHLDPYDHRLAQYLRGGVDNFRNRTTLDKVALKSVNDAKELNSIYSTENCVLSTIAVQTSENGLDDLRLDGRLFEHPKHSELSRAVLMSHEVAYRIARFYGQTDSRNTRSLIGMLVRHGNHRPVGDFLTEIKKLGFANGRATANQLLEGMAFKLQLLVSDSYKAYDDGQMATRERFHLQLSMAAGNVVSLYNDSCNECVKEPVGPKGTYPLSAYKTFNFDQIQSILVESKDLTYDDWITHFGNYTDGNSWLSLERPFGKTYSMTAALTGTSPDTHSQTIIRLMMERAQQRNDFFPLFEARDKAVIEALQATIAESFDTDFALLSAGYSSEVLAQIKTEIIPMIDVIAKNARWRSDIRASEVSQVEPTVIKKVPALLTAPMVW